MVAFPLIRLAHGLCLFVRLFVCLFEYLNARVATGTLRGSRTAHRASGAAAPPASSECACCAAASAGLGGLIVRATRSYAAQSLEIHEDATGNVFVKDLSVIPVTTPEEALTIVQVPS